MTFSPIRGLVNARAAAWRGQFLVFDHVCLNCGLVPYILEEATENVRKWAVRLVPLAPVDTCIKLAARILIHPDKAADLCNAMDTETFYTMRHFLPAYDGRQ